MNRRTRAGPLWALALLTAYALCPPAGCSCGDTGGGPEIQVLILAPGDGSDFTRGRPVTFRGEAHDSRGPLGPDMLLWTSSLDGELGTGQELTRSDLTQGLHEITLTAQNEDGQQASDSVSISISPSAENLPPVPEIVYPTEGQSFDQGSAVPLTGQAQDPEDGPLSGSSLVWTSDLDGLLGNGQQLSVTSLSLGSQVITLTAIDGGGLTGRDTVAIHIVPVGQNHPPRVAILTPENGAAFIEGESIEFTGQAEDDEDGPIGGDSLSWTSDLDGTLGVGPTLTATLSLGAHVITLTATDTDGASASDVMTLSVNPAGNEPPRVTILSPADGQTFEQGQPVQFQGEALDPEDGTLTGEALQWTSDLDGPLGTGEELGSPGMSIGYHWIRLVATDSGSATGSDSIHLRIVEPVENLPPTAAILAPPDNSSFERGIPIQFQGQGSDPEDGQLQGAALTWTSDLDGSIGSGETFSVSSLSEGLHHITLTVFDSQAAFDQDAITLEITPQQVENLPPNAVLTGPAETMAQSEVILDGSGSWDADGTVVRWVFDFGDGSPVQDGPDSTAIHVFNEEGVKTVTLTVYDDEGDSAQATHPILVTPYQQLPEVVEDSRDRLGSRCALGFTPDNRALIAYRNDTHPAVRLAEQQPDGTFSILTVEGFGLDVGGDAGNNVDMETDSLGDIHLAYLLIDSSGSAVLRYAHGDGANFTLVEIDAIGDRGTFPLTLQLNPQTSKPEILYSSSTDAEVKHACCQGDCLQSNSWIIASVYVETRGRAGTNNAYSGGFGIQPDGTRHATIDARWQNTSYYDRAELIHIANSGAGWGNPETIIPEGYSGDYYEDTDATRLVLDPFDQPLVIHFNGIYHRAGAADWPLSMVERNGLNYFDLTFDKTLDTAYLVNRHGSEIEIIAENERSYWLYEALGPQDQALPEIKLDQESLPRACFARDGNILLY